MPRRHRMGVARHVACSGVLLFMAFGAWGDQESALRSSGESDTKREPAALESVTVTARKHRAILNERISTFVSLIAIPSHTEGLARWQVPICPFVTGVTKGQAEYMQGRVSQVAEGAGVPVQSGACAPNLIVVLTPDPRQFVKSWWSENPRFFNQDRGIGGVRRFMDSDEPIRAFYNACSVAPELTRMFNLRGGPACSTGALGSRLTWSSVRAIYSVIVVADLNQIEGLNVGQLADYMALIGLAQIRRDSELGNLPTILSLFAQGAAPRPQGLTSWDRSFLRSLYATEQGNIVQLSQIRTRMQDDIAP